MSDSSKKEICLNCKWWDSLDIISGYCRVEPPVYVSPSYSGWRISGRDDWCGKFTSKPMAVEDRQFLEAMSDTGESLRDRSPDELSRQESSSPYGSGPLSQAGLINQIMKMVNSLEGDCAEVELRGYEMAQNDVLTMLSEFREKNICQKVDTIAISDSSEASTFELAGEAASRVLSKLKPGNQS